MNNRVKKKYFAIFSLLMLSPMAWSATCNKAMNNTMINGDLTVPAGATCIINNTVVNGDVTAQKNSTLVVDKATVHGNINAESAKVVKILTSAIQGDVKTSHISAAFVIDKSSINGDLSCLGNARLSGGNNAISGSKSAQCK